MIAADEWQPELDSRRQAVGAIVERAGCDALLVFGSHGRGEQFRYLTSFAPVLGDMWLVWGDGRSSCVLDFDWQVEEARRRSGLDDWRGGGRPVETVAELLTELEPRSLAVAGLDRLPVTAFELLRSRLRDTAVFDVGAEVAELRRRKSPLEVKALREAARLTDRGLEVARAEAQPGVTERELAARIGQALGPEWSFPPTVVSGNERPIPIREPTERRLEDGDTVMVDIGASYDGYQADATRTFVLGDPSTLQRRVWDVVLRAYEAALEKARPGVACVELQRAAAAATEDAGFGLAHRVGHGIGLQTSFEWPDLASEQTPLEPGVTICIE
ncbi:MAG: Xaa-Pro peptidase family protein, partial [Gaiellaceae bacterium]